MKLTPQIAAAGGVVLLCLIPTLGVFLAGVGSYRIDSTEQTVPVDPSAVTDRGAALDPLVPDYGGIRSRNPFNLKQEAQRVGLDIPLPPPPSLRLPDPPPVPGGQP